MESRLKVLGHPVHPMLVMFPVGLLVTAVLFDLVDTVGGPDFLGEVAYWNITVGLIGGLLARRPGRSTCWPSRRPPARSGWR